MSKEKFRKPGSISGVRALLLSTTLLMAYSSAKVYTQHASIRGIAPRDHAKYDGVGGCSFAGGCEIMLAGDKFDGDSNQNMIWMKTSTLTGSEIKIPAPGLSQEDTFDSGSSNKKLAYKTPSALDLFPNLQMQDFKPFTEVLWNLEVTNAADERLTCATSSKCNVKYRWDYTPKMKEISPKVLVPGIDTTLFVIPERAMDYKKTGELPLDWRIDGLSPDMTIDASKSLWRWGTNYIKGKVLNEDRNSDVNVDVMFRGVGKAWTEFEDGRICNILQTDCYTARIHPTITSVSAAGGYSSGGQILKLTGTSLDALESLEVDVDGTSCRLLSNSKHEIYCETNEHVLKDPQNIYAGEHGLIRTMYNNTTPRPTKDNLDQVENQAKRSIMTSFEIPYATDEVNSFDTMKGFFKAEVNGLYQFQMSGDDWQYFYMSIPETGAGGRRVLKKNNCDTYSGELYEFEDENPCSNDEQDSEEDEIEDPVEFDTERRLNVEPQYAEESYTKDPANKRLLIQRIGHSGGFRKVTSKTEWINMKAGQLYYMEGHLLQATGGLYYSLGVEIDPIDDQIIREPQHPQTTPQEMSLRIHQTVNKRDTTELEVLGADGGVFLLAFLKPDASGDSDNDYHLTKNITAGASASEVKSAIRDYYRRGDVAGTDPQVSMKLCRGFDELEIDCSSPAEEIRDYVYNIKVPRSISKPSCMAVMVIPMSTQAFVKVNLPSQINKLSQPPLAGSYIIKCFELDGIDRYTSPLQISNNNVHVYDAISRACPGLMGRFSVTQNKVVGCTFNQDCIAWDLKFDSVYGSLNQFEILSNDGVIPTALGHGGDPLVGKNVELEQVQLLPRGPNIMYPAVPFEMLRTAHEKPQIRVKVDGMAAICTGLMCDYEYEAPQGLITGFSVNGLDISIQGSNLPSELTSVRLAQTNCAVTSNNANSIECTLVTPWVAGKWLPAVRDAKGRIPIDDSVQVHEVDYIVTSMHPPKMVAAGWEVITFYGENFPSNLGDHPGFKIQWEDGTPCIPFQSTATELKCRNQPFSKEVQAQAIAEHAGGGRRQLQFGSSLADIAGMFFSFGFGGGRFTPAPTPTTMSIGSFGSTPAPVTPAAPTIPTTPTTPTTPASPTGSLFNGMGGFTLQTPTPTLETDPITREEEDPVVVIRSTVEQPFKMDNADTEFVGPIDIIEIELTLSEDVVPPETLSTYFEVELISDPGNVDPTNAHGGNFRPLKVLKNDVVDSAGGGQAQAGTITVSFHGAYSGDYTYKVTGKGGSTERNFATVKTSGDPVPLKVGVELLDFHPKEGSAYGGQLIKLYGWNFVDRMLENVVKIGATIGGTNQYCVVESVFRTGSISGSGPPIGSLNYNSEIECRIMTDYTRTAHQAEVIVFASTFEEAVSNSINPDEDPTWDNLYTFIDPSDPSIPTITSTPVPIAYDHGEKAYVITAATTGVTDTDTTTFEYVHIGGINQEDGTISISPTELKVKITDMASGGLENAQTFEIFFSQGLPNPSGGNADISLTPVIIELATQTWSVAGNVVYFHVAGIGEDDVNNIQFVDANDSNLELCQAGTIEVLRYAVVKCTTIEYTSGTVKTLGGAGEGEVAVKMTIAGTPTIYKCDDAPLAGLTCPDAKFGLVPAFDQPKQATPLFGYLLGLSQAKDYEMYVNVGTALQFAFVECEMYYYGVKSDTCADFSGIGLERTFQVTYNLGLPKVQPDTTIDFYIAQIGGTSCGVGTFCYDPLGIEGKVWVKTDYNGLTFDSTRTDFFGQPYIGLLGLNGIGPSATCPTCTGTGITLTGLTPPFNSNLRCGYGGGCEINISADSLFGNVVSEHTKVEVCGRECTFSSNNDPNAFFPFPYTDYKCILPSVQTTYMYLTYNGFDTSKGGVMGSANPDSVYTNNNAISVAGTFVEQCALIEPANPYQGGLTEFKFFIDNFSKPKSNYAGKLKLEYSSDFYAISTVTTLLTVGEEVNEGWNYYDIEAMFGVAPVASLRLVSTIAGGCDDISVVEFIGVENIDTSLSAYFCDIKLTGPFNPDPLVSPLTIGTVEYTDLNTAWITSITPRFGGVQGGDQVKFEIFFGTGFPQGTFVVNPALISVYLDDQLCTSPTWTPGILNNGHLECTTGPRIGEWTEPPNTVIYFDGFLMVANQGKHYIYVSKWSDDATWGPALKPLAYESVHIPSGMNLIVDESVPVLNLVIVDEGAQLIFPCDPDDENTLRTFDVNYIFINGGYMEVGTEDDPYCSKIEITFHGKKYDPQMPIYGNKGIAVRTGSLEMHGKPIETVWTTLTSTANAGDTTLEVDATLTGSWKAGDEIIITSSEVADESEVRTIAAVSGNLIELTSALLYKHYGDEDSYSWLQTDNATPESASFTNPRIIRLAAEVGLLTRNIVFQGALTGEKNEPEYGAHIMLSSEGEETSVGKVEYVEMKNVGQAYMRGRYPFNFHKLGTCNESYIRGNSIMTSFNRAVAINGVNNLRVQNNVFYDIRGHGIFFEEAGETKNLIENNLVAKVTASFSLLQSDQQPAAFYITNPDNQFIGNSASSSAGCGYWFNLQEHPTGSSFTTSICPIQSKLGEFRNNIAHSNFDHGLRIWSGFGGHSPRGPDACAAIDDVDNPVRTAYYEDYTGWKNGRNGVMAGEMGACVFKNLILADNDLAGFEVEVDSNESDNVGYLDGALIIGKTDANSVAPFSAPHGVITPRTERYWIKNVFFANFNFVGVIKDCEGTAEECENIPAAAVGTSSLSYSDREGSTDSGARTTFFSGIMYNQNLDVTRVIRYQFPFKAILQDTDCSLFSGNTARLGTPTSTPCWLSPYWHHLNDVPECEADTVLTQDISRLGGIYCSTPIRRLAVHNYQPGSLNYKNMYIMFNDDSRYTGLTPHEKYAEINDRTKMSKVAWRRFENPDHHWVVPAVPNHKYRILFGDAAILDFDYLRLQVSQYLWTTAEGDFDVELPFTEYRESVKVMTQDGSEHADLSRSSSLPTAVMGNRDWQDTIDPTFTNPDNIEKLVKVIVSGDTPDVNWVDISMKRCVLECDFVTTISYGAGGTECKGWSDPAAWTGQFDTERIPIEGDYVRIPLGTCVIIDIDECQMPKLQFLEINGLLKSLDNGVPRALKSHSIWVRAGELQIGTEEARYQSIFTIMLLGDSKAYNWAFSNQSEMSNKALVVTGTLNLHGAIHDTTKTRLKANVEVDSQAINVVSSAGILGFTSGAAEGSDTHPSLVENCNFRPKKGDTLAINTSNMDTKGIEYCEADVVNANGYITCKNVMNNLQETSSEFKKFHYGAGSIASGWGGVDMRSEVVVLDRTITIIAETDTMTQSGYVGPDTEYWGCRVLVADWMDSGQEVEGSPTFRNGVAKMDYVEVKHCGQKGTWRPALKFELNMSGGSLVQHSTVHSGLGIGLMFQQSGNIQFNDNAIVSQVEHGLWIKQGSTTIEFDNNWVMYIWPQDYYFEAPGPVMDEWEGWTGCVTISDPSNSKLIVSNNIVSGCWHHGYHYIPLECGETIDANTQTNFLANTAHSVSGNGAVAANVDNTCTEVSGFTAYKCTQSSITLGGPSGTNKGRDIISIDVGQGIGVHGGECGDVELEDCEVYGEFRDNPDCKDVPLGDCDYCYDRYGLILPSIFDEAHKDKETINSDWMPMFNYSNCFESGTVTWTGIKFYNYYAGGGKDANEATCDGAFQSAIGSQAKQPNYVPYIQMTNPVIDNVAQSAVAFFWSPYTGWVNKEDCGDFPCTANLNIVIRVSGATNTGGAWNGFSGLFSIISSESEYLNYETNVGDTISVCNQNSDWNAYFCDNVDDFGLLLFESLDADAQDRSIQPVYMKNADLTGTDGPFENILNAFIDDCEDGFYTCLKRDAKFPALVYVKSPSNKYDIEFTSNVPEQLKFNLRADSGVTEGVILNIKYNRANSFSILKNGVLEAPNGFAPGGDGAILKAAMLPVTGTGCGENNYEGGGTNILSFYITPGTCEISVMPRNVIQLGVRLEFTVAEFFQSGGTSTFAHRMASLLEIHFADIRVVSIYNGPYSRRRELQSSQTPSSTVIEFEVYQGELETAEEIENEDPSFFDKVASRFESVFETVVDFMDTPVLNAVKEGKPVETVAEKERGDSAKDDIFIFQSQFPGELEEEEDIIQTEIRYKKAEVTSQEIAAGGFTYGMLLAIMISVLVLILIIVCIYNKFAKQRGKLVKEVTDQAPVEKVQAKKGRLQAQSLEQQYRPEQTEEGDFGGVSFTHDGRNSTLVGLKTRNDTMQRTGDKFTVDLAEPNFGDDENELEMDLSAAKIKKKETTTAKINDYDSGSFDQYSSVDKLGQSPVFESLKLSEEKDKEFPEPQKEDSLWEEKQESDGNSNTFVVDAKLRKSHNDFEEF